MSPIGLVLLSLGWSAAVWAAASLICRMKPVPKMAQAIWRGAALMLLAPFVASLFVPGLPRMAAAPLPDVPVLEPLFVAPAAGEAVAVTPAMKLPEIGVLIIALVAAGWLVRLALWVVSQVRLQRLKMRAMATRRPIGHWAEAVGLRRTPKVHVIPYGTPFLAGVLQRSVYVPSALINGEGAQQVIVHELVHLKRGDLVTRPLERVVADLFWFSPFAWAIRERLDYWREAVVDEETIDLTGDRIAYARTLTSAARASRVGAVLPVAAFILRKKGTLKMRLNELLTEKTRPRRLGLVMAVALGLAAPLAIAQGMMIKGETPAGALTYSHAVLDEARLTSAYGVRKHPITKKSGWHNGVDLAAPEGTPVYAPIGGTVTRSEMTEGYGNLVVLKGPGDRQYRFGQLQELKVKAGDIVRAGDVVGLVGQTGQATGPHLHFEVWHGDKPDDPLTEEGLDLANRLVINANSGAKMPLAPPAPDPVAPLADLSEPEPAPPAPPALDLDPAVPTEAPPAPPLEPVEVSEACKAFDAWIQHTPTTASWTAREDAAREANRQAGLMLDADWVPKSVANPYPVFPAAAATSGTGGACWVMFDLGTDGLPKNKMAECTDPMFEDSALELPGARFEPVKGPDGKAVEVKGVTYPLEYCLQ